MRSLAGSGHKDLLEYVVVHELLHLIEPTHNERFLTLMSKHYPSWHEARAELNVTLVVRPERRSYDLRRRAAEFGLAVIRHGAKVRTSGA